MTAPPRARSAGRPPKIPNALRWQLYVDPPLRPPAPPPAEDSERAALAALRRPRRARARRSPSAHRRRRPARRDAPTHGRLRRRHDHPEGGVTVARANAAAADEQTDEQRQAAESLAADPPVFTGDPSLDQPSPIGDAGADWGAVDDDRPLSVHEAIIEVIGRAESIPKSRESDQGYKFRGIDDVMSALSPILAEVGLSIRPYEVLEREREQRATRSGGTLYVTHLRVRYKLTAADGTFDFGEAWGEGSDSGDKATGKAHSQAYKSFLLQQFMIGTEDSAKNDPDATNPEQSRPITADEQQRAGAAYDAALEADTVEKLAGVRRRSLALLHVPVRMADGSLIPLGLLFDSRRQAIERPLAQAASGQ